LSFIEKSDRGVRSAAYKSSSQANNLMMCPGENEQRIILFFYFHITIIYVPTYKYIYSLKQTYVYRYLSEQNKSLQILLNCVI